MSAKVSVIVPAYNAQLTLPLCLQALLREADEHTEIVVVNDGSTDSTAAIAGQMGVQVLETNRPRSGPAAARNQGSRSATGDVLFFVDADVVIHPGAISLVRDILHKQPDVAAVFGSYDDAPAEQNFLSQYKNLLHHFVHQNSETDAQTFWAGCGAIRKDLFVLLNGFNSQAYTQPSIEDIEFGIRLKRANHSIRLEKRLQAKHLKRWTPLSLLKADILYRAYPWSRLIAEMGEIPNQLNLRMSHRISSLIAATFFAFVTAAILWQSGWLAVVAALMLVLSVFLNSKLYAFFLRANGLLFTCGAIFWHMLYYVYSAIIFAYCWIRFRVLTSLRRGFLPSKVNVASHEKR